MALGHDLSGLAARAAEVIAAARSAAWRITTAESCTGGLIAASLTEVAGSSDVFEVGRVTYSNAAKSDLLDVPENLLTVYGAVSAQVAQAMAVGALERAEADLALSATGIAGPGGGTAEKPVGLVYIAMAVRDGETRVERLDLNGDRSAIRRETVSRAFDLALGTLQP